MGISIKELERVKISLGIDPDKIRGVIEGSISKYTKQKVELHMEYS